MIKKISQYGGGKQTPDSIVIHAMGEYIKGSFGILHATDYLENIAKLSAHYFIWPNGEIVQGREDDDIAYHAAGYNSNSIGIEFLVKGEHDYGTFLTAIKTDYVFEKQFEVGKNLVSELMQIYSISKIDRHSDLSPERKVDPGTGFKWLKFLQEIQ